MYLETGDDGIVVCKECGTLYNLYELDKCPCCELRKTPLELFFENNFRNDEEL